MKAAPAAGSPGHAPQHGHRHRAAAAPRPARGTGTGTGTGDRHRHRHRHRHRRPAPPAPAPEPDGTGTGTGTGTGYRHDDRNRHPGAPDARRDVRRPHHRPHRDPGSELTMGRHSTAPTRAGWRARSAPQPPSGAAAPSSPDPPPGRPARGGRADHVQLPADGARAGELGGRRRSAGRGAGGGRDGRGAADGHRRRSGGGHPRRPGAAQCRDAGPDHRADLRRRAGPDVDPAGARGAPSSPGPGDVLRGRLPGRDQPRAAPRHPGRGLRGGDPHLHPPRPGRGVRDARWTASSPRPSSSWTGPSASPATCCGRPTPRAANAVDNDALRSFREAGADGYVTVLSDIDSRDWQRPGIDAIVRDSQPRERRGRDRAAARRGR